MSANIKSLFGEGKLAAAIEAQMALVKDKPTDVDARAYLSDLLSFSGDLERADRQLDLIATQNPALQVGVALARQLVRAATARKEVFEKGRVPEFIGGSDAASEASLRALVALRGGDGPGAQAILAEAEAARPPLKGTCDDQPFEGLRDGDDVLAGVLEVMSSTGKYFWIPWSRVISLELRKAQRPRDLLWRPAGLHVSDGPDGEVYIPAVYPTPPAADAPDAEACRLGRVTDWIGGEGTPVRGIGLRTLLVGEDGKPLHDIGAIAIEMPSTG